MAKRDVMRYSEAFKLQAVRAIESGKYDSCFQAMQAYGIRGCDTMLLT